MKKIVAILLLFSLLIQVTGYHLIFRIRQDDIRSAVRKNLFENKLPGTVVHFIFDAEPAKDRENPEWESNHEFSFHGEMYDVISKETRDGKVFVRCISDKNETDLLSQYKEMNRHDFDNSSNKKSGILLKLIASLYTCETESPFHLVPACGKQLSTYLQKEIAGISFEIPKPPPQLV